MKTYKTLRNVNRKLMFAGYTGSQLMGVFLVSLLLGFVNFLVCILFIMGAVWWSKKNSKNVSEGEYEYLTALQLKAKNIRQIDGNLS